MRITGKTVWILPSAVSLFFLFSCVSVDQPAPTKGPTEYSRIQFGTELNGLLEENRFNDAIELFSHVPEPDASDPAILRLKLAVLISAQNFEEATILANNLESATPNDPDILYFQAVLSGAQGNPKGRTKYLNKVIQLKPDHSLALAGVGLDLLARKNYKQAKEWLVKAVSANPKNTDALLGLGRAYYMDNDLTKAEDMLSLAISQDPQHSVLWAERARVYSENGNRPKALEDIQKAIALDKTVYGHWLDYGTYLMSMGRQKPSRDAFTEALKIDPEQYIAYIYRAGLNDDLGDTKAAISDYQNIVRLYPQYYFAAESLGILLWGQGDYAGSSEAFLQALTYNAKNTSYALMYTLCLYQENRPDDAKNFMSKYLTTLDRTTTEYFLCRLFVDKSGDADVLNRIMREKNINNRNRMLFYSAMYYELFQSTSIAQKYYLEVVSVPVPNFFEYRLSQWALSNLESAVQKSNKKDIKG
ncbi:MAG TPA: tetratricopeptide repeat protein [Treponema sp.]|nr:tetratricopeptide repeat protein [Treponema sp.]